MDLPIPKFKYRNLKLASATISQEGTVCLSAEIEKWEPEGTEVVQFYVHDKVAPTSRSVRELKGFQRFALAAGEHRTVEFAVKAKDWDSYDSQMH